MALTNAEKQAQWRERREQRIKSLEQRVAELEQQLRNQAPQETTVRLEWEAVTDDDGQTYFRAERPMVCRSGRHRQSASSQPSSCAAADALPVAGLGF